VTVLIVGAKGNMGRRYSAVLNYLGKHWMGADAEHSPELIRKRAAKCDGVIIATPTDTHAGLISLCADLGKPILCEKPLTKDVGEMKRIAQEVKAKKTNLTMVFQYKEIVNPLAIGWSYYNNWNHGRDGLAWDCIQIVALARSSLSLQEDSPIWRCRINGQKLRIEDMDRAYVKMMERWFREPGQDVGEIQAIHEKTDAVHRSNQLVTD
jgi:hypothetical protein